MNCCSANPKLGMVAALSTPGGQPWTTSTPAAARRSTASESTAPTSPASGQPGSSSTTPSRRPFARRGVAGGVARWAAMIDSAVRTSAGVRAMGPIVLIQPRSGGSAAAGAPGGANPFCGTVFAVGRSPYTPQNAAGMRIEPTRSEPQSRNVSPAATAAADPPLEPPGLRVGACGLFVRPYSSFAVCAKSASIVATFVLPTRIAPAARSRRTAAASSAAVQPACSGRPQVVGSPAVWKASFTLIGTPASAPAAAPEARAPSTRRASARARSAQVTTTALRSAFATSSAASIASTSSTELTSPRRIAAAAPVASARPRGSSKRSPAP
jgi:hypothetical protein